MFYLCDREIRIDRASGDCMGAYPPISIAERDMGGARPARRGCSARSGLPIRVCRFPQIGGKGVFARHLPRDRIACCRGGERMEFRKRSSTFLRRDVPTSRGTSGDRRSQNMGTSSRAIRAALALCSGIARAKRMRTTRAAAVAAMSRWSISAIWGEMRGSLRGGHALLSERRSINPHGGPRELPNLPYVAVEEQKRHLRPKREGPKSEVRYRRFVKWMRPKSIADWRSGERRALWDKRALGS